jgi:hypothetical protein
VMLCAIEHANLTTGRCDVGQRRIARECNLTRQYVNEAMIWWEENTSFLGIETRTGRTNAYHIQWANLEVDWHEIQKRIRSTEGGVSTLTRQGVSTQCRQGGVNTDPTLNINKNRKEELHHEMVPPPSAADTEIDEERKGHSGESATLTPKGLTTAELLPINDGCQYWTDRVAQYTKALGGPNR